MKKELEGFSESDLRLELAERAEVRRLQEEQRRREFELIVGKNIDALLALVPNHQRTSCSDGDPSNADRARCTRCVLLATQDAGFLPDGFDLSIEVTTRPEST